MEGWGQRMGLGEGWSGLSYFYLDTKKTAVVLQSVRPPCTFHHQEVGLLTIDNKHNSCFIAFSVIVYFFFFLSFCNIAFNLLCQSNTIKLYCQIFLLHLWYNKSKKKNTLPLMLL